MIILDLTPNEQMIIERESQKQGLSITQYIKSKLFDIKSTPAEHEKPLNPMIARAMALDNPTSYTDKNPVELQREWRNEW